MILLIVKNSESSIKELHVLYKSVKLSPLLSPTIMNFSLLLSKERL